MAPTDQQRHEATHRLYIDDSGAKQYSRAGVYHDGNTRYFVLGGVLTAMDIAPRIARDLRKVKARYFETADVEVKSNWLRIPNEQQRRYLDPYGIDREHLDRFVTEFHAHLLEFDFVTVAAVVDKVQMAENEDLQDPLTAAYDAIIQLALREVGSRASFSVEIDSMGGLTPGSTPLDRGLRQHHEQMQLSGSGMQGGALQERLRSRITFVDSARSELVQVADLVAYNVFRQFREHGDGWETEGLAVLPADGYVRRLFGMFPTGDDGRIHGYGLVKVPQ